MPLVIQNWLLKQMKATNPLDAVAVTVKLAVRQFGTKKVAKELHRLAIHLEKTGTVSGWNFPNEPGNT